MEKVNLTKTFLFLVTNSQQNINSPKAYNGGCCGMVLIKNVTTTTKGDQYLRAQHYIILTKVVDKAIRACLHSYTTNYQVLNLHLKKSIPILSFASFFIPNLQKTLNRT
jgi:hypothetical protein